MKPLKKIPLLLLLPLIFPYTAYGASTQEVRVTIGASTYVSGGASHPMDAVAYISTASNSTMVPLRFVANAFGLSDDKIAWDSASKTATISAADRTIQFTAGSSTVKVDGISSKMTSPDGKEVMAELKTINGSGRMYLPFRALGDAFGASVNWDSGTRTAIYIISGESQSTPTPAPASSAQKQNKQPKPASGFYFANNGGYIALNEDIQQVIADIGQPSGSFEAPSCAFPGVDKTYYYNGFEVTTYPADDGDRIQTITLTDASVKTPEGASLGMSLDQVTGIYGNDFSKMLELYSYEKGDVRISFLLENNAVSDITYYYLPVAKLSQ